MVFFRESCFRQSGDRARKANPTHYRNPREYFRIFDGAEVAAGAGKASWLELVTCKCIDTYVRVKHNQNQICWKWRKVGGCWADGCWAAAEVDCRRRRAACAGITVLLRLLRHEAGGAAAAHSGVVPIIRSWGRGRGYAACCQGCLPCSIPG